MRRDPETVVAKAQGNLDRWIESRGPLPVLLEWRRLLDELRVNELEEVLVGSDEDSTRLRQSSPFAGVLGAREVWEIKRGHEEARA